MSGFFRKHFYKYRHHKVFRFLYFGVKNLIKTIFHPWYWRDYFKFKNSNKRFKIGFLDLFPITSEKTKDTQFDSHYVYHVAWAIRKVLEIKKEKNIQKHIDFSSSLHFVADLSAYLPVEFYDYRPVKLTLSNLTTGEADLTNLKNFQDNSIESLSCLHVIEHIGLGRYGDPIDPEGDIKAINELKRICATGGSILFVTPVGRERIQFNAHRIYAYDTISKLFGDEFILQEFSLVTDEHKFLTEVDLNEAPDLVAKQYYGCGCFWFVKK